MTCPNCQNLCGETDSFCFRCGTPLTPPAPKKGRHVIPIALLILMSALGIILFFAIPLDDAPAASDTPWFTIVAGTLYFNGELYTGGTELSVPDTVNGQSVKAIGEGCFADSAELTAVVLPDSVISIGHYAFSGCTALRGIHLPEGLVTIGTGAFQGCVALEAITIPSTVLSIGEYTFDACGKLFYIFYNGEFSGWEALYSGYITPYTQVACTDGIHRHR